MFTDIFLDCGSLLTLPVIGRRPPGSTVRSCPELSGLYSATTKLRELLDYVSDLGDSSSLSFTINDWTRLITALTLSFRMSFPLSQCPEFDSTWARSEIQLDVFLSRVSGGQRVPGAPPANILSANRAVFSVMKSKYQDRLTSLHDAPTPTPPARETFGCPILNSSMRQYIDPRDARLMDMPTDSDAFEQLPVFNDLWSSMVMDWPDSEYVNADILDAPF